MRGRLALMLQFATERPTRGTPWARQASACGFGGW